MTQIWASEAVALHHALFADADRWGYPPYRRVQLARVKHPLPAIPASWLYSYRALLCGVGCTMYRHANLVEASLNCDGWPVVDFRGASWVLI